MSREKMLQAEIALKDAQLADLTKEIERLRREAEESGKRAQSAVGNESKIAELNHTIGKLALAAKKTVQYAAELQEARRRLAVVEKERSELSKNYAATDGQTAALKSALAEAQSDALRFDAERKEVARRARKAEAVLKTATRQKLIATIAAVLVCVGTISGSYAYVTAAFKPPAELSEKAAAAFKQYTPEFRRVVELAVQNERENLVAERNRYQQLNENTFWDKIASYGWSALIFGGGFVVGVVAIVGAFVFRIR